MAETIAVLSQKGGTGKTTTVRTLTDVLRRIGLDVLAIDLDPQGNLSDYFDVPPDADPDDRRRPRAATPRRRAPCTTGSSRPTPILAEAERALTGKMGRELTLRKALQATSRKSHDVILLDCPPALGLLTVNALVAADYALISAEAQYFALQGVEQALEVIELARENLNPDLEWLGVVLNIADMRTVHSREAFASLEEHFGDKVFETTIRSRSPTRSRPSGRVDPRPPAGPRRRLRGADRRAARPASASEAERQRLAPLLATARGVSPPALALLAPRPRWPRRAAAGLTWRPRRSPHASAAPARRRRPDRGVPCQRADAGAQPRPRGRWLTAQVVRRTCCAALPGGARIARVAHATEFGSPRVLSVVRRRRGWLGVLAALATGRVGGSRVRGPLGAYRTLAWVDHSSGA